MLLADESVDTLARMSCGISQQRHFCLADVADTRAASPPGTRGVGAVGKENPGPAPLLPIGDRDQRSSGAGAHSGARRGSPLLTLFVHENPLWLGLTAR